MTPSRLAGWRRQRVAALAVAWALVGLLTGQAGLHSDLHSEHAQHPTEDCAYCLHGDAPAAVARTISTTAELVAGSDPAQSTVFRLPLARVFQAYAPRAPPIHT